VLAGSCFFREYQSIAITGQHKQSGSYKERSSRGALKKGKKRDSKYAQLRSIRFWQDKNTTKSSSSKRKKR
jgi:hypothetical protein